VNLIKELNLSYILLLRKILCSKLIEEKLNRINYKVTEKLKNKNNFTLDKIFCLNLNNKKLLIIFFLFNSK